MLKRIKCKENHKNKNKKLMLKRIKCLYLDVHSMRFHILNVLYHFSSFHNMSLD